MPSRDWNELLPAVERLIEAAERALDDSSSEAAKGTAEPHAKDSLAYRWRGGRVEAVAFPDLFPLDELIGVERSVARLRANAEAFTSGRPALDVLLYGERGTGKSSAVRGLLREFGPRGFRLVEIQRDAFAELPEIFAWIRPREERFGLFCDDLSFEAGDASYKRLKAALDGGLESRPANAIILATSNRRLLVPERASDNLEATLDAHNDLHPGETAEEKVSVSDRFGLMLPFLAFNQETYLRIVDHYAQALGLALPRQELHARALRFALQRAGRSGRTARQACIAIQQDSV
ncbi:MAG: ATP-binding protein [Deltaproteobacteria bacterium]|nr:ATP-binding protein [Deltaproteobacteria bacterium]MBW2414183.1 ATP-binding protein [Deltaproteobacteria bacterium]